MAPKLICIVLGLVTPISSAFVASSPTRSQLGARHGGPGPRPRVSAPSMADSSEVAAKRLVLEAAFAKGELKEANKRLKILLMQTTAAKGAVAGVVAASAVAVGATPATPRPPARRATRAHSACWLVLSSAAASLSRHEARPARPWPCSWSMAAARRSSGSACQSTMRTRDQPSELQISGS